VVRCLPHPWPLSSQVDFKETSAVVGWRGECKRERGRSPLSKISPPLKHNAYGSLSMPLFERGTQGVSIGQQPNANGNILRGDSAGISWLA